MTTVRLVGINGPRTPQPPVYGTLGIPESSNMPGSRELAAKWIDSQGNFWFFGGNGQDSKPIYGLLNDLWQYNPVSNQWTWMSGSNTTAGASAVYGTLGTPAPGNQPGGRNAAVSWTDSSGDFWLFGGSGLDAAGQSGYLNDLWEYTPTAHQWTWIGGANTYNQRGVYGSLGKSSATNTPGGRSNAASWTDVHGNFWLIGGNGSDAAGNFGPLDDIWEFSPVTRQWTWMGGGGTLPGCGSGCGAPAVYGQIGIAAAANTPGGRASASGWVDPPGNFWLFGGSGFDASTSPPTNGRGWPAPALRFVPMQWDRMPPARSTPPAMAHWEYPLPATPPGAALSLRVGQITKATSG